jgi:hypothetical protein
MANVSVTTRFGARQNGMSADLAFPKTRKVILKYAVPNFTLNAAPGGIDTRIFRANSLNDPDYAIGGQQPRGFDQWASFYSQYTVIGARIKVTAYQTGGATGCGFIGIYMSPDSGQFPSDTTGLLEAVNNNWVWTNFRTGDLDIRTVSQTFSAKKFLGKLGDDESAAVNSNPVNGAYFHVWYAAQDPTVDPPVINCTAEVEYIALFKEPKPLPQS